MISRAPGMVKDLIRDAMATGAREDELLERAATMSTISGGMTVTGKRGKRRTIDLDPFDGYDLLRALPTYVGAPLLFWHSDGESYKNFASQFSAIVDRTAKWAKANDVEFRPVPIPRPAALACGRLAQVGPLDLRAAAPARPRQHQDDGGLPAGRLSHLRGAADRQGRVEVAQKVAQAPRRGTVGA